MHPAKLATGRENINQVRFRLAERNDVAKSLRVCLGLYFWPRYLFVTDIRIRVLSIISWFIARS